MAKRKRKVKSLWGGSSLASLPGKLKDENKINPKRLGKYDKICQGCGKVIKRAIAERGEGNSSSYYLGKWYHLRCHPLK